MTEHPVYTIAQLLIDGRWVTTDLEPITVINPATGRHAGIGPQAGLSEIHAAVSAARTAFDTGPWPQMTAQARARILAGAAIRYEHEMTQMAELVTAENGSPVGFTAQTEHPLEILHWYCDLGLGVPFYGEQRDDGVYVHREPVGVVAVIVPWNMPQKTIMMKVAPALLAGCTVVIKPAPETPLDALVLARIFTEAGVPPGVINVVPAYPAVAEKLVTHPSVDKVAFTGSTAAGRHLAALAGADIRRIGLELGGKSPCLVLDDADPGAVAEALRRDTFLMSGQICSAHTRVLVPEHQLTTYVDALATMIDSLQVGDPQDPATEIGPLVTRRQQLRVQSYINAAVTDGQSEMVMGHTAPPDRAGWFITPALFVTSNATRIAREEVFGPVAVLIPYTDLNEGVTIANDSPYGLEAGVWTSDRRRAIEVSRRLRVGTVRINGAVPALHSPLGGYKQSGIGRELGWEGLLGYLEVKAVAG